MLWLVVAHDLLQNRYMDDVKGNLFSLLCSTWRAVLKMLVRLFRIKQVKSLQKSLAGAVYRKEKWKNGDKKSSRQLEIASTARKLHRQANLVVSRQTGFPSASLHLLIKPMVSTEPAIPSARL